MKKHKWQKGETISGTRLRYVCEGGYKAKHRLVVCYCSNCGTTRAFRLDHITSGKTKTCGCHLNDMIKTGKLTAYSVRMRKEKPTLQRGGWHYKNGLVLFIGEQYYNQVKDMKVSDLILRLDEYK